MFLAIVNSVKKLCCCSCSQQLDEDNVIIDSTESVNEGGLEQNSSGENFTPSTYDAEDFRNGIRNRQEPKPSITSQQRFNRKFDYFVDKNVDKDNLTKRVFQEIPQVHHTRTVHEEVSEKSAARFTHYAEDFRNGIQNRQEPKPSIISQQRFNCKFDYFVDKDVDEDNPTKRVFQEIPQVHHTRTVHEEVPEKSAARFTHYAEDFRNRQEPKPSIISHQQFNRRFDYFVDKNVDEDNSTKRVLQEIPQFHQTRTVHEEVPEKSAEFYRRKAQQHFDKKRQFYEIAHRCKGNGEQNLADHYFKRAKLQARLAETANNNAAAVILQENQAPNRSKATIDLHHLFVKEALEALDRFLDQEITFLRNDSLKRSSLRVITGRGKHSANGIPKIKPAVIARLEERNLKYNEINAGYLRVVVSKNSELGNNAFRASPLRL